MTEYFKFTSQLGLTFTVVFQKTHYRLGGYNHSLC